jgi:hypothetical protein
MKLFTFLFVFCFMSLALFAQSVLEPMPEQDYMSYILKTLSTAGQLKGLALVAVIVQLIMNSFRTNAVINLLGGKLKPSVQWTLVALLNLVGVIVVLKDQQISWPAIFVHANTLAAWQVFYHQGYKLYLEKKH